MVCFHSITYGPILLSSGEFQRRTKHSTHPAHCCRGFEAAHRSSNTGNQCTVEVCVYSQGVCAQSSVIIVCAATQRCFCTLRSDPILDAIMHTCLYSHGVMWHNVSAVHVAALDHCVLPISHIRTSLDVVCVYMCRPLPV